MSKKNVKECLEMSINVIKCQKMTKMSKNFEKNSRKSKKSIDLKKYQKMSKDVKNVKRNIEKNSKMSKIM